MASSPATSSDTVIMTADSLTILNVNMANITKLTDFNFLMWSHQVHAILDDHGLAGYVDGSLVAPPRTIITDGTTIVNREFTQWKRQYKLIYGALLGAISVNVQPILSTVDTSAAAWEKLLDTYAKPSRSHILQLRRQIKHWKKGNMLISEYVRGFTTRFDQLALLGAPYTHEDQIDFVLEGLPDDYKQVLDQTASREKAPSITELHEKLINHELKLQAQAAIDSYSLPITANAVNYRGNVSNKNINGNNYRGQQQRFNNKSNQTWQQNQLFRPHNDQYSRGYQGKCQICGVFGHGARRCSQLQFSGGTISTPSQYSPSLVPWQPRANMVAASSSYNPNPWILDSGATHHLTTDLNNLALHQPYNGGEEVTIADGSSLTI